MNRLASKKLCRLKHFDKSETITPFLKFNNCLISSSTLEKDIDLIPYSCYLLLMATVIIGECDKI